jgi:hypothetical protein
MAEDPSSLNYAVAGCHSYNLDHNPIADINSEMNYISVTAKYEHSSM